MECQCSTISSIPLLLKQWILKICLCQNIEPPTGSILDVKEYTLLIQAILKHYHTALKYLNVPENTTNCNKSIKYEDIEEPIVQSLLLQHCRYTKYYNESNVGSQLLFLLDLYILFYGKGIVWHFWKDLFKMCKSFPSTNKKCDPEWSIITFPIKISNERIYPSKFSELWNSTSKKPLKNCDIGLSSLIRDSLHPKEYIATEKQNVSGCCHIYPQTRKRCEREVYLQQKVNSFMASAYQNMRNASNYNFVGNCIQKMSIPECALKIYLSKDDQQRNYYRNLHRTATIDNTITNTHKEDNIQYYLGRAERYKAKMERKEEELKRKAHHKAINGICAQIVTDILDISMKILAYRSRGETISEHAWKKLRELFCASEEVTSKWQECSPTDLISRKMDLKERHLEVISKRELEKYMEKRGRWESKYEHKSPGEPKSQPFLANIVINLLNLKQTTQETGRLKKYPITAIVVGLEDLQLLEIIRQRLNEKKVLPILPSVVISSCISSYLHMNANAAREDCSLWGCIREHLNIVEISQKYSRQFKNSIKSELKKLSLLGEMVNEEIQIWNNNISSRGNKFTLNTESKDVTNTFYAEKATKLYTKISKLESKKPLEGENLSRKPLDMLSTKYESGNGMDRKVQYGRLAYQSLCLGGNIEDSILVEMILEYVREMDPEEGWVLFNFPETTQQAVMLEEALTGRKVPWLQGEEYYIHGQAVPSSEIHKLVDTDKSGRIGSLLVNIPCLTKEVKWKSYFNRYINASPLHKMNYTPLDSFYKKEKIFYRSYPQDATNVYLEEIIRYATEVGREPTNHDCILGPWSDEKSPILADDCIKIASKTLSEESTAENTKTLLDGVQSRCLIKEPSYLNLKMPNTIRHMLAHFWEVLENDYQTKIKSMLLGLRLHDEVHSQCLSSIERRFYIFVERPGELQISLNRFQILLTAFDDDAKNDLDIANYLFTKWWEMKAEMHRSINESHKENIRFLHCLLKGMTETDCSLLSIYLIGLEAEVSRCLKTLQIINDYYHAMVKGRPSGFKSKWFHFVPLTKWKENSNIGKHLQSGTKMTRKNQKDEETISKEKEAKSGVKGRDRSEKKIKEGNRITEKEENKRKSQKKNSLEIEGNEHNLEKQIKYSEINTQITEAIISSWEKGHILMPLVDDTLTRFQCSKEKLEEERVSIEKYIQDLEKKIQKRAEEKHCKDKKIIKKKKKEGESNEELQLSSDSSLSSSDTDISISEQEMWRGKAEDERVWEEWKGAVEEEVERTKEAVASLREDLEENMTNLQRELSTLVQSLNSLCERRLQNERQCISLASEYLLHAILKKAKRCHYISLPDMKGGWLLTHKSTAPYFAPTSVTTNFCLCQLDHLRCIFSHSFPKGLIQNTSFASILYETTKISLCLEEHHWLNLWTRLSLKEVEMMVQECFGKCNWVNWRDFLAQALTLPKPTVGDLVDAVNKYRQLDASLSGSLPFEDYCNVILWFERERELDDRGQRMVNMPCSLEMQTKYQWERSKFPAKFKMSAQKATERKQRGDFMDTYMKETLKLRNQNIKHPSLEKGIQKTLHDPHRVHRLIESNKFVSKELLLANSSLPKRVQSELKGTGSEERMMANERHSKAGFKSEEIPTEIAASGSEIKREFECSKEDEQKKEIGDEEIMKSKGSERNGCLLDTSIVQIEMVKRQLFETFRDKNGRVNYVALLLAFCKDEDAEEGLRKAISLYAGKIVNRKYDVVDNTMMRFYKKRELLAKSGKMTVHPAEQWTIEGDHKNRILGEDLTRKEMVKDDLERSESLDLQSSLYQSQVILSEGTERDNLTVSMHNKLNIDELKPKQLDRNPGHTLLNTPTVASTAKLRVEFRKKLGRFQCHQPMHAFKSHSIGHLDLKETKSHAINKFHSDLSKGREDHSELRKYHLDENPDFSESSCLMPTEVITNIVEESLGKIMGPSEASAPSTEISKSQCQQEKSSTSGRSESCWSAHGIQHTLNERDDSLRELSSGIVLERKMPKMNVTESLVESASVAADVHLERRGGPSIHGKKQTATSRNVKLQNVKAIGSPPPESVPMRHEPSKQCIGEDKSVGVANPLRPKEGTMDLAAKGLQGPETKSISMENWTYLKRHHDKAATILIADLKNPQQLWLGKQSGCQESEKSLPSRIFILKESKGGNGTRKEDESAEKKGVVKEVLEEMESNTWHKFKMHIALQLIRDCLKNLSPKIHEDNSKISIYYQKITDILRNDEENRCYLQQDIDLSYLKRFSIFKTFQKLNMYKQFDVNGIIRKLVMENFDDNIQKGKM